MTEDRFAEILERLDRRIAEVWTAIDRMRVKVYRIDLRQTEKIARMEAQLSANKWLIGLVVAQILGWAFWVLRP